MFRSAQSRGTHHVALRTKQSVYSVTYLRDATQGLARLPRNLAARIAEKIEDVAADPYGDHPNVTRLKGRDGYRLRVGSWRIIYDLDDRRRRVTVLAVGSRGQVYRR